jgi:NitT/TauT family transport system permease protein
MSFAGGWFFLMAAEIFTVGQRDFRLPGLGAFLQAAADQGNWTALAWGIGVLVFIVVTLDQLLWRPLLAWSDRFSLAQVSSETPPTSWFYEAVHGSFLAGLLEDRVLNPLSELLDRLFLRSNSTPGQPERQASRPSWAAYLAYLVGLLVVLYGIYRAGVMASSLSLQEWASVGIGLLATLLRVALALFIALAWTLPLGVAIGTNRRLAAFLQPVVQVVASVPATALFPAFLLLLIGLPGGLNLAAVLLMLMGTQWYLLFNVIAGASAIPQDLKYTTTMLQLGGWQRWRTLILPGLFPFIVTGAITASGGAWNASIVAEHVTFAGKTYNVAGIGAVIARATATGNYPLLLVGTLSMVFTVVLINRLVWRRLYSLAEEQYRME